MLPTPDLSHLSAGDYLKVYEPAEDTFILLDALEKDASELRAMQPMLCLEIGSGTGCVSSFIGQILGSSALLYLCTDINPHACQYTVRTGTQNKVSLDTVNAAFALPFQHRLARSIDILLFNPPYVPTTDEEAQDAQETSQIQASWAGGADGMSVTEIFLQMVPKLLAPLGRFYLVAVQENHISAIQERMLRDHSLKSEVVLQRRAGREHLFVLRFQWEAKR